MTHEELAAEYEATQARLAHAGRVAAQLVDQLAMARQAEQQLVGRLQLLGELMGSVPPMVPPPETVESSTEE